MTTSLNLHINYLMANNEHPITPPPELVQAWVDDWYNAKVKHDELIAFIATQAANWGYDQAIKELEAFLEKEDARR